MGAAESIDPNASLWDWLTYDLRRYRVKHGQTLEQIGRIINRSKGWVSNVENGRRRLGDVEAKMLDRLWDTGGHFLRLLTFARAGHDPDWFKQHVEYEPKAVVLKIYEALVVPGLLQTEEYAHALLREGGVDQLDVLVATRMARQKTLSRHKPPLLWVLLDEGVLDRPVGGRQIMRDQLERLLEVSELPDTRLRVVPRSAGAHDGLDGSFKIMTVDTGDVAYLEAPQGGRLVPDFSEVRSFGIRYDRIGAKALPVDSSRSLIKQTLEEMS
jgi:transcriptional regulator with XRE-family HTH domain